MTGLLTHSGKPLHVTTYPKFTVVTTTTAMPSGQTSVQKTPTSAPALPVVIYCHGLNSNPDEMRTGVGALLTDGISQAGFATIAVQMHDTGVTTLPYANNNVLADIEEGVTYARAHMGAAGTGRIYVCFSGGGQSGCVSAFNHLADTVALALFAPLVDANGWYTYNWNLFNSQVVMDAAYNSPNAPTGGWTANKATRDPTLIGTGFGSVPMKIWYGTGISTPWNFGAGQVSVDGDGIIPTSTVTGFQTAVGNTVELQPVAGAGHFATNSLGVSVPATQLLEFLNRMVTIPSVTRKAIGV